MKFSEFFEIWLHERYYKNGANIGKKGDFYTSVSVGWLFGAAHANYFLKCLDANELSAKCSVVEIGANSGDMLADFIQGVFTLRPEILGELNFAIVEPHEILREIQLQTFKARFGDEVKLTHFKNLDECALDEAFIISNELFDSFACEVIEGENMLFINENHKPFWSRTDDEILKICTGLGLEKGEICLKFMDFAGQISKAFKRVKFLSFDYGEWGAKNDFSLRLYKNHQVFNFFEISDLSEYFGVSDMTYDVDFSHLSSAFESAGFKTAKFKRQNLALVQDFRIDEILALTLEMGGEKAYQNAAKQMKFLSAAEFLGERFKFIEFTKF
ncbi:MULTISPECIES: SAM-dependent methyltransferase [Campylobacter]|uniref:SAM-dependent methyltransferase n=1 Tax=Campylobacter TaxID=194 RepID=UPI0014708016|nr:MULTISPECIES: SAM-dependent methyltransferase [Campylobacter]MDU6826357.1 SAM-dependent methyltransferase [Campylobacter sp.]